MAIKPMELALYGKGGIGKSTISANLSAALAAAGRRVLQIGCDPKHDSTRLLMGGRMLPTVLEQLRTSGDDTPLDSVLGTGLHGIGCIEAGGPRPGVGCAGRGIISAFEYLERHGVKDRYDIVLYDVLGDVVCGGFAVPIRREYADAIFLVTSGEYMAIYAANNILRGIRNYDGSEHRRVAGILFNRRNVVGERDRVERFADAVKLPIVAEIPRSDAFARAEEQKCTVSELEDATEEKAVFQRLAEKITDALPLYESLPLTDEELESCVLYGMRTQATPFMERPAQPTRKLLPDIEPESVSPPPKRQPLYGCAFNGAATAAIHLTDAVILAHAPRACAFYTWQTISSSGRKNLFQRGILLPSAVSPHYECTDIGRSEAVFGGMDRLRERVGAALERRPGAVIVISSCVSGIIGDDVLSVEDMSTPETPVIVIPADGDINGDYMAGIEMCHHKLINSLVDRSVPVIPDTVNIIGETGVANNLELNYRTARELLEKLGLRINCRFLGDATTEEVRRLLSARLNILAADTPDNRKLKKWLEGEYGCRFHPEPLPVGAWATGRFLREVGAFFGRETAAEEVIGREEERFRARAERLRPALAGKRVLLTTINANMDWLLDAAEAAGVEFVWIGVLNYLHQDMKITDRPERRAIVEEIADWPLVMRHISELRPDIVLSNYTSAVPPGDYIVDNMPMGHTVGFSAGLELLERGPRLLKENREGAWMRDQQLFEKYFA